jgi:hypothetical protein
VPYFKRNAVDCAQAALQRTLRTALPCELRILGHLTTTYLLEWCIAYKIRSSGYSCRL